jgi:hypothetical protein
MEITPVFPPNTDPIDFDNIDCQIIGTDVNMVDEQELNYDAPPSVLEISNSNTQIRFFVDCARPFLVLHFKTIKKFVTLEFICLDEDGNEKIFISSNKTSFVTVEKNTCTLPLTTNQDGWQYCLINLEDLMADAFSCIYYKCREIVVHGSCRLSKIFFESKQYADIELPSFLRVVNVP